MHSDFPRHQGRMHLGVFQSKAGPQRWLVNNLMRAGTACGCCLSSRSLNEVHRSTPELERMARCVRDSKQHPQQHTSTVVWKHQPLPSTQD